MGATKMHLVIVTTITNINGKITTLIFMYFQGKFFLVILSILHTVIFLI